MTVKTIRQRLLTLMATTSIAKDKFALERFQEAVDAIG